MRKENGTFHMIQGFCSPQDRATLIGETQGPPLSRLTPAPLIREERGFSWIRGTCSASPTPAPHGEVSVYDKEGGVFVSGTRFQ